MSKLRIEDQDATKRLKILTKGLVTSKIIGGYRSSFKGKGLEFLDYRRYTPNDDAAGIDWKASVKSKELLIKEFVEERNVNVFFLIDISSSMAFSSIDKLKMEYAAEVVSTLSYTVTRAGDSVGFATFNDKIVIYNLPKNGISQHFTLMKTLVEPKNYGGNYNLVEALKFILATLKEYSVVIIISDFIGLKDEWKKYLKIVGKKFDLIGIMVRDPIERQLPEYSGQIVLGDYFSNKQLLVNTDDVKEKYYRYAEAQEKEVNDAFIEAKGDFIKFTTDKPFIKSLIDFFLKRAARHR